MATRINVTLTDDAYQELQRTASESGMDMSEFVRNSLRVMNTLKREQKKGNQVLIGQHGKVEKEVLIP
jgi:metal-responsive CopG/Arc/MetJ family transcriptional regulator